MECHEVFFIFLPTLQTCQQGRTLWSFFYLLYILKLFVIIALMPKELHQFHTDNPLHKSCINYTESQTKSWSGVSTVLNFNVLGWFRCEWFAFQSVENTKTNFTLYGVMVSSWRVVQNNKHKQEFSEFIRAGIMLWRTQSKNGFTRISVIL